MMADEQPDKESGITPKGAVEIQEEDLDQASGGQDYLKVNTYDLSPQKKVGYDLTGQKVAPADPSIGLLQGDPGKKI
jgi:hypothetical protein